MLILIHTTVFHNKFHSYFLLQQQKSVDDTVSCRDDIFVLPEDIQYPRFT
jgi:hypothetical protein